MSPTFLEYLVAALLLWVAWQIGLVLAPHLSGYFRRLRRRPKAEPTVADRAAAAFHDVTPPSPHANDR